MISKAVRMIYSAYRRDDFADPDMFIAQAGAILERYPDDVVAEISHPFTGVQRRCKFPPSISELVDACEAAVVYRERIDRLRAIPTPQPIRIEGPREHLANLLVRREAPQYPAMCERAANEPNTRLWRHDQDGRGIWIVQDWMD